MHRAGASAQRGDVQHTSRLTDRGTVVIILGQKRCYLLTITQHRFHQQRGQPAVQLACLLLEVSTIEAAPQYTLAWELRFFVAAAHKLRVRCHNVRLPVTAQSLIERGKCRVAACYVRVAGLAE